MSKQNNTIAQMIPIKRIKVLNPRVRSKKKFQQIVSNIFKLGLKKPITVSRCGKKDGVDYFDLVCGQGRLEAYIALDQTEIPAIVIDISEEECLLMSLVENLARRKRTTIETVREIGALKDRGYTYSETATKIDMKPEYVRGIVHLLKNGEERLLNAVEKGQIPISIAVEISKSDDEGIQRTLRKAYESNKLRGRELINAKRMIEFRLTKGKSLFTRSMKNRKKELSADALVRMYRQESVRQKILLKKAELCETRLLFVVSALKELFKDTNFVTLLRAESLEALPKNLANLIKLRGGDTNYGEISQNGI